MVHLEEHEQGGGEGEEMDLWTVSTSIKDHQMALGFVLESVVYWP